MNTHNNAHNSPAGHPPKKRVSKSRIIAASVVIAAIVSVCSLFISIQSTPLVALIMGVYVALVVVATQIQHKNKVIRVLSHVFYLPALLLLRCIPLLKSLHLLFAVYTIVTAVVFVVLIWLPQIIWNYKLQLPAITYIVLSTTAIITASFGDRIIESICTWIFSEKYKQKILDNINQKKIRYFNLLLYFCAIIVFTIASLTNLPIFNIDRLDYSILQSFATYISYDRLVRNYDTIVNKKGEDKDDSII